MKKLMGILTLAGLTAGVFFLCLSAQEAENDANELSVGKKARSLVVTAYSSDVPPERTQALERLAEIGMEKLLPAFVKILEDVLAKDVITITDFYAMRGVLVCFRSAHGKMEQLRPALYSVVTRTPWKFERIEGNEGTPWKMIRLEEVLQFAALAIGAIGDASDSHILFGLLNEGPTFTRGMAVIALGGIGREESIEPLEKLAASLANDNKLSALYWWTKRAIRMIRLRLVVDVAQKRKELLQVLQGTHPVNLLVENSDNAGQASESCKWALRDLRGEAFADVAPVLRSLWDENKLPRDLAPEVLYTIWVHGGEVSEKEYQKLRFYLLVPPKKAE